MPDVLRLAVLIDADNASASVIGDILAEISKLGTASVKRIYGDFTTSNLQGWKGILAEHAIQPVQQFRNTTGKSATDSALIIDAMDLLHTRQLQGFCLVSSDSDFTRLATRMREDGLPVYGFGEAKTPKSFINACDRFIYTEIFRTRGVASDNSKAEAKSNPLRDVKSDQTLKAALDQ
ncbi:MAG: NYN domain-containing protein, partial [Alphaproteobacteria bacterium]|nr:NYN domain-containing protein [Alphaproteobacteria bacterium]